MMKASITKKTLSVFLSLLMIMSCCITAFPTLADKFGLKGLIADAAANYTNLTARLNDYETALAMPNGTARTYALENAEFYFVKELGAVVAAYGVTGGSHGSSGSSSKSNIYYNNGSKIWMAQLRNAVISNTGSTNNSNRTALINKYMPVAKVADGTNANEGYISSSPAAGSISGKNSHTSDHDSPTASDSPLNGKTVNADTETVAATRSLAAALSEYSNINSVPDSVVLSYSITYHSGTQNVDGHYDDKTLFWYQCYVRRWQYYYFTSDPTLNTKSTADTREIKKAISNFIARFGANESSYGSQVTVADLKAAIDDRPNFDSLYKLDNKIDTIVSENATVYNALYSPTATVLNTTGVNATQWLNAWKLFIDNEKWVPYIKGTFMPNCEAAQLAKNNKTNIKNLNSYYDIGTTVTPENLTEQERNYDAALNLYNTLRTNLDSSQSTANKTVKDIAVSHLQKLGTIDSTQAASELKAWNDYAQYLADLKENIERCKTRVLKEKISDLLDELAPTYVAPPTEEDSHLFRQSNNEGEDFPVLTDERLQSLSVEIKSYYTELQSFDQAIVKDVFENEGLYLVAGKENDDNYKFTLASVAVKIGELNQEATIRHFDPEITDLMAYYQYQNGRDLTLYSVTEAVLRSEVDTAIGKLARANEIYNVLVNGNSDYVAVGEAVAKTMFLDINSDPATDLRTELQNLINKFYDRMFEKMKTDAEAIYALFTEQGSVVNINNFKLIQNGINTLKANEDDFYKYLMGQDPYNTRDMSRTKGLMNANRGNPYFRGTNSGNYQQTVAGLYQWLKAELKALCDEYQQKRFDNYKQTQLEDESSTGSSTKDSYAYRESTDNDFARRDDDPDYYATTKRVQDAINDLDKFLTSKDLPKLLDLKKTLADGTQVPYTKLNSEEEVENLSELIDAVLREKLFSDDLMNTLVDALYGSISRLLGYQLGNLLFDTSGAGGQKWDPLDLFTLGSMIGDNGTNTLQLNLSGRWTIISYSLESVSIDGGNVELYLNGKNGTTTLTNLLSSLGVDIYPEKLADKLSAYPSIQQKLRDAANWQPNYVPSATTAQSRTDYNKYMGPIYGDWTAVNLSNGEIYDAVGNGGYNPYLYKYDEATDSYKLDFEWGINGDYERFVNALGVILDSIKPLLQVILCGKENYKQTIGNDAIYVNGHDATVTVNNARAAGIISMQYTQVGVDLNGKAGGTLALSIKDADGKFIKGFNDIFGPIYEALGIPDYQYKTGGAGSTLVDNLSQNATGSEMAHAIVDPLNELIKQVTNHPLDKILSILPNIAFSLSFDLLQPLIDQINIDIVFTLGIGSLEITDVDVKDSSWPDWLVQILLDALKGVLANALRDNLKPDIPVSLALGDLVNLSELLGVDMTDLNAILVKFLGNSENPNIAALVNNIPIMNTPVLGTLGVLMGQKNSGTVYEDSIRQQSRYGVPAGKRYTIKADKPDVLWFILSYLGEALGSKDFRDVILDFIGIGGDGSALSDILNTILANTSADPEALPLAIVEIFQPYLDASKQKSGYSLQDYNWWSQNTGANEPMLGKSAASYLYLLYGNDWTYTKARAFYEDADLIITNLLRNQIQEQKDENGKPLYSTFGQWLQSLVNLAWSNEAVTTVARLLVTMGNAVDIPILNYIISRFTENGMDITVWHDNYGYLFPEVYENTSLLDSTDGEEGEGEEAEAGKPVPPAPGEDGYENHSVLSRLTAVRDENYEYELTITGEKRYPNRGVQWYFDGVALEDGDRHAFQEMLEYLLGNMMPAIDIFLSGEAGTLFGQNKWNGPSDTTTLITIPGNNGYDNALVPLLEAIGINASSDYILDGNENPPVNSFKLKTQAEFDALPLYSTETQEGKVSYLFNMAFGFVEALSQNDQAAVDAGEIAENEIGAYNHLIQNLLTIVVPGLLYFLESNGLSTVLLNLLKPVLILVDDLLPVLGLNTVENNITDVLDVILVPLLNNLFGYEEGSESEIKTIGLDLKDLSIHKIAKVLENVTDLNLDPLTYGIDAICAVDRAVAYSASSVCTAGGNAYNRYTFSDLLEGQEADGKSGYNDPANTITVLLSLLIDLVEAESQIPGKTNAEVVVDLIGNFADLGAIGEMIPAIVKALRESKLSDAWFMDPNWFYFDPLYDNGTTHDYVNDYKTTDIGDIPAVTMPVRSIYYLRYAKEGLLLDSNNLWNEANATYLEASLKSIIDLVIGFVTDYDSLNAFLDDQWKEGAGIYTNKTINSIASALNGFVAPALEQFSELLNVFLGFDSTYWGKGDYAKEVVEEVENAETQVALVSYTPEDFSKELTKLFLPLDGGKEGEKGLLSWLIAGKALAFFHSYKSSEGYTYIDDENKDSLGTVYDLVSIPGGRGYEMGLVPIIEALGFDLPAIKYVPETGAYTDEDGNDLTGIDMLTMAVSSILRQVNELLKEADPVKALLNRIPNILYFLNANGLVASVINLVAPIAPLATTIAPLLLGTDNAEVEGETLTPNEQFIALLDSIVKGAVKDEDGNSKLPETFSLGTLDLVGVFDLLKAFLNLDINSAVTMRDPALTEGDTAYNYLKYFFLGDITPFKSANGNTAFRMNFNDKEEFHDLLTILIYTVFDVLYAPENDDFFINILAGVKDEDDEETKAEKLALGAEKLTSLRSLLTLTVGADEYVGYDWFYFDEDLRNDYYGRAALEEDARLAKIEELLRAFTQTANSGYVVPGKYNTMTNLVSSYLHYTNANWWNEEKAKLTQDSLVDLINTVIQAVAKDDTATLDSFVADKWDELGLYSKKYEYMIGSALAGVMSDLDENLRNLLGIIPGFDATAWDAYKGVEITDEENAPYTKAEFIEKLHDIFVPFGYILDWLLVGQDHAIEIFFKKDNTAAISIGGANGFAEGLVPLIEAITGVPFDTDEVKAVKTGIDAVDLTLKMVTDWVDDVIAGKNTAGEQVGLLKALVERIPNILYFINSNGLSVTVQNLLRSVTKLLETVAGVAGSGENGAISTNINDLLSLDKYGIDVYDLSLEGLLNIVKGVTAKDGKKGLDILNATIVVDFDEEGNPIYNTDTNDNPILTSYLQRFAFGIVKAYTSGNGKQMYMMDFAGDQAIDDINKLERINLFTVLICTVLDVFRYKDNEEFLRPTLDGIQEGLYDTIYKILNYVADEISYQQYNWFYFNGDQNLVMNDPADYITTNSFSGEKTEYAIEYKSSSIGYLQYKNFWRFADENGNTGIAMYVRNNFYDILNTVIGAVTKDEYTNINTFISEKWSGLNLYTDYNVYNIGAQLGNVMSGIDGTLKTVLGLVIGIDFSSWDQYADLAEEVKENPTNIGREEFVKRLVNMFAPAEPILNWFFMGLDTPLQFFYRNDGSPAINLPGGNGYDAAIVPLLEALGCEPDANATALLDEEGNRSGLKAVQYTANLLLDKIDTIVNHKDENDKPDCVEQIVALLPELIYFINANGLGVTVNNLLKPVEGLLGAVGSLISTDVEINDVNGLVEFALGEIAKSNPDLSAVEGIDVLHLDIPSIFTIVAKLTGLEINKAATYEGYNIYEHLALGIIQRFESAARYSKEDYNANAKVYGYRMKPAVFTTEDQRALNNIDMISILVATIIEVFTLEDNKDALVGFIGEDLYNTINGVLSIKKSDNYLNYNWINTNQTGSTTSPLDRISSISGTAGYDRYWTKEMAQYVADNLLKVVDNTLLLIGLDFGIPGGSIESVGQLIAYYLPGGLYTNENMGKLVELVLNALAQLDEIDQADLIKEVLNIALGIDLNNFDSYKGKTEFGFTDGDRNGFVNALSTFLKPVYPLLKWLMLDEDIAFFHKKDKSDAISIPGGQGYKYAVIPILEAVVGYQNSGIKSVDAYKSDIAKNENAILTDILNPVLDFVDAVLADPLNTILQRLPAITYFINSHGVNTALHNLLNPVYQVLTAIKSLVDIDIDAAINDALRSALDGMVENIEDVSLENLDFNMLLSALVGLLPDNLKNLRTLVVDAVNEFTIGTVTRYNSKSGEPAYTMVYGRSTGSGGANNSVNATLADMVTIVLRFALKWLTLSENQPIVREFLTENISDENVRQYVLAAYGDAGNGSPTGLLGFLPQPYGISMMMGLMYYVFFAWDVASAQAIGFAGSAGKYWQYVSGTLASSNQSYIQAFAAYITGLIQRVEDRNNPGSGSGNTGNTGGNTGNTGSGSSGSSGSSSSGSLNFFQRIIKWFQDLFARIRSLFSR